MNINIFDRKLFVEDGEWSDESVLRACERPVWDALLVAIMLVLILASLALTLFIMARLYGWYGFDLYYCRILVCYPLLLNSQSFSIVKCTYQSGRSPLV